MQNQRTISLVLGSGGARGLAHIGVIHCLEENGFKIKSISGCSMGALIGGVYAAGKLDEVEKWLRAITKMDMVTLLDLTWDSGGFVKGDKIINTIIELVGDQLIENLPIKFTAVATDIDHEKELWLNSGRLFDAIRASISLPLFFTPFNYKGFRLIDGGVLNPVPIAPTFSDGTDITIAVNLGGPAEISVESIAVRKPHENETSAIREKINNFISRFKLPEKNKVQRNWGPYDIASKAFDTMQSTIARQKLAAYPPDYIIEIPKNACGTLEFFRSSEMIELGYSRTEANLAKLISESQRIVR